MIKQMKNKLGGELVASSDEDLYYVKYRFYKCTIDLEANIFFPDQLYKHPLVLNYWTNPRNVSYQIHVFPVNKLLIHKIIKHGKFSAR